MKRIYYIDWLRILAILMVFFFHSSHFFDPIYWHVKNPQTSESVLLFLGFVNIWIMPLFFFLSGAAGIFGLNKSFAVQLKNKTFRLLVPLIFGIIVLIPPQKYVEALSNHHFAGGYFEFLRYYFSGGIFGYPIGFDVLWIGAISYHLWFLGHLFIISLALFPVMRWISHHGDKLVYLIRKATSFSGGALLMFIPIAVERILLRKHYPGYTSWCDLLMYAVYFLYGFIYIRDERLRQALVRSRWAALFTGVVLFVAYISSFQVKGTAWGALFQNNQVFGYYMFQESAGALATWSWIIFIVAMGMKFLDRDSAWRKPLNEGVLPFYIIHQTVLLLIGYVVVQWSWGNWAKFGMIATSSLFLILVIYLLIIRPFNPVRFLFGMGKKD